MLTLYGQRVPHEHKDVAERFFMTVLRIKQRRKWGTKWVRDDIK